MTSNLSPPTTTTPTPLGPDGFAAGKKQVEIVIERLFSSTLYKSSLGKSNKWKRAKEGSGFISTLKRVNFLLEIGR